jgi:hypothetical protein
VKQAAPSQLRRICSAAERVRLLSFMNFGPRRSGSGGRNGSSFRLISVGTLGTLLSVRNDGQTILKTQWSLRTTPSRQGPDGFMLQG